MANFPKKSKDPTEVALSAIQDALNVRETEQKPAADAPAVAVAVPTATVALPQVPPEARRRGALVAPTPIDEDLFLDPAGGAPVRDEAQPSRRAANDDRATIGQILQSLQRRPARTPYTIAAISSLAWVVCALGLAYSYSPELGSLASQGAAATPVLVTLAAMFCAPIGFFFVLAHMLSRSLELRIIAQSMAEVAVRLAEPEAVARESIVSVGQAIRREVAAMGDGVERALARAAELESLVNNEVSSLERAYSDNEVRIRSLLDSLAQQRETLVGQAEQVRSAISTVHLDLTHDITQVSEAVSERIGDAAMRITRALAEKGEHITNALGTAGDSMIEAIGDRGGDLLERLESTSAETAGAIVSASDRLTASLNFKTDHIGEEFAQIATNIRDMMASRLDGVIEGFSQKSEEVIDSMESRSRSLTDAIVDSSSRIAETIAIRADEVNNTLKSTGDSLVLDLSLRGGDVVSKLEQTGTKITETIIQRTDTMSDAFRQSAEALAATIGTRGDAVHDMLAQRLQSFEQMFTDGGSQLAERIGRDSSSLGNLITRHLGEFDRTVKTYGGELVDRLGNRTHEVTEAMRTYLEGFDGKVTTKAVEVTTSLDQRLARFQEALDSRTQTLNEQLNSRVTDIARTVSEGGKEVVDALDKRITDVTGTIASRGAALADTIGAKIEDIDKALGSRAMEVANSLDSRIMRFEDLLIGRAETVTKEIETRTKNAADLLNARMEQLASSITTNAGAAERSLGSLATTTTEAIRSSASDVERSLTTLSTGVTSVLKQNATEVERTLLGVSSEVARNFVGRADEIAEAVSKRSAELTRILDDKSSTLLAAISGKSVEFSDEVARVTDQAVKQIEAKGFTFTSTMMDNSQQLARIINDAGENASKSVNKTLQDLQHATEDAVEQSKQTAKSTVTEILETHGMLSSDTTALFERLREANLLLREVMGGAQENMTSIEQLLSTRVNEFVTTMNQLIERTGTTTGRMDENLTSFYTLTSRVLGDLGDLAGHFQGHGQALASAVEMLDKSNRRTEDSVNDRRSSLDSLLSTLDIRTEDLDQRLKRFSGLLDESLAAAEGRARDIARVVAESTSDGVRTISEQYDIVRATADEERKRTTSAMRTVYEQATGDAHAMFRDSMERFTEIVEGMKHMSGDMQRELDATRQELRRGVLELPQETAESAAQMRRVIVDQIEALAELNRIVARHGRSFDAAEPVRRGAQEPLLAVVGGGRGEATAARTSGRTELGDTSMPVLGTPAPRRTEATASRGSGPSGPSGPTGPGRGGWLSDLLSRASREPDDQGRSEDRGRGDERAPPPRDDRTPRSEDRPGRTEDRSPRHTIESLDSLSVDIARMIDHDAAAELWDRYNRGERNVFTRRLYTMQGQKTFDEIRKRYRADREFKQTVDRYISEFERLLDEVSRDDRGQVVVRTYLTSETGKVYTMLAHAAGRFD